VGEVKVPVQFILCNLCYFNLTPTLRPYES
jgi:hypothetical protein